MTRIILVAGLLLIGCNNQPKTNTAHDPASAEAVPGHSVPAEHKMPESPKVKADDSIR